MPICPGVGINPDVLVARFADRTGAAIGQNYAIAIVKIVWVELVQFER